MVEDYDVAVVEGDGVDADEDLGWAWGRRGVDVLFEDEGAWRGNLPRLVLVGGHGEFGTLRI